MVHMWIAPNERGPFAALEGRSTAGWSIDAQIDLVRSREEERPVVELVRLGRTGD
jgi:hypothetical protein